MHSVTNHEVVDEFCCLGFHVSDSLLNADDCLVRYWCAMVATIVGDHLEVREGA